ncbi:MAG: hypothetical protein R3E90_13590 [Marinicella sp.]
MKSSPLVTHSKPFVSLFFIALLSLTTQSPAGVFYLLVSADNGIETVDEIFEEFNQGATPQTLLTIFNDYPPESVEYLQSFNRPATPPANPDSTTGRQYRRLLVSYPYPLGVTEVMDYFQSSPLIETASYDGNLEPIIFTPENPMAGDEVLLDIVLFPNDCGNLAVSLNPQGSAHDLNLSGNNMILDVSYQYFPPGQPVGCFGERPYTQFNLGQLAPGSYQIQVNMVGHNTLFPANDSERQHLTDITLVVQGSGTAVVPVNFTNFWSLLLLMVAILAITFAKRKWV